jgi:uncharacterized protein (DUF362 family)
MPPKIDRRNFLKNTTGLLTGLAVSSSLRSNLFAEERADIAVVEGTNPALQTRAAVQALGGIKAFVRRGDRVVLLPNSEWRHAGAVVNPAIGVEIARLCAEAGAASIVLTTNYGLGRWGQEVSRQLESAGVRVKVPSHPKDYTTVPVPDFRARKEVTILKEAMEHDVLIDIPVFKDHYGARISGSIKNLMGFNWNSIAFHQGETYLQQSIADLASVIRPHLCVVDATTILAENGPGGPGRTLRPNQVIAGADMVALDAFCCPLLKRKPEEVGHIVYLDRAGRGQVDV